VLGAEYSYKGTNLSRVSNQKTGEKSNSTQIYLGFQIKRQEKRAIQLRCLQQELIKGADRDHDLTEW
jgi:hypothetical protein